MRSFTAVIAIIVAVVTTTTTTTGVDAWTLPSTPTSSLSAQQKTQQQQQQHHGMTRKSMLQTLVQSGAAAAATVAFFPQTGFAATVEKLPSGVTYEVVKAGSGPKPEIGELVAIRFAAFYGDRKIDDIFGTFHFCSVFVRLHECLCLRACVRPGLALFCALLLVNLCKFSMMVLNWLFDPIQSHYDLVSHLQICSFLPLCLPLSAWLCGVPTDTPEPYYTRLGSGGLLKGVEQTLPLMQLGDRWKLTIPSTLAFGPKGR
jgi:FKBP-type peptidyl-prolyl cis-trans isomerase